MKYKKLNHNVTHIMSAQDRQTDTHTHTEYCQHQLRLGAQMERTAQEEEEDDEGILRQMVTRETGRV